MGWLEGWQYRKKHEVNGSTAGSVSDYQIRITVHYGSGTDNGEHVYLNEKCRVDFGDVRFTADDGATVLDYWIEKKVDGDYAVFWVKIPSIPASPNAATIYIYYGNPEATSISNPEATFQIFDDFLTKDTTKWNWISSIYGSPYVSGGVAYFPRDTRIASKTLPLDHAAIRAKAMIPSGVTQTVCRFGLFCTYKTTDVDKSYQGMLVYPHDYYRTRGSYLVYVKDGGNRVDGDGILAYQTAVYPSYNVWYTVEIRRYGSIVKFDDGLGNVLSGTDTRFTGFFGAGFMSIGNAPKYAALDLIIYRNYVEPEPSHGTWGSEETPVFVPPPSLKVLRYVIDFVDYILPADYNDQVDNWRALLDYLKALEWDVSKLEPVISSMNYVSYNEEVRSEDYNKLVDAFKAFVVLLDECGIYTDAANRLRDIVSQMQYLRSGDIYYAEHHNIMKEAWDTVIELVAELSE